MIFQVEPLITIYGEQWVRALNRVDALPITVRPPFARMLAAMEEGWKFAGPMQVAVEAGGDRSGYTNTEVVYFAAEVLIVDLFRTLALEVVDGIPDPREAQGPDILLDDLESESELLMRYLVLTEAALRHPDVDPGARAALLDPVIGLREWMADFWARLGEMEAALLALDLPERLEYRSRAQRFAR